MRGAVTLAAELSFGQPVPMFDVAVQEETAKKVLRFFNTCLPFDDRPRNILPLLPSRQSEKVADYRAAIRGRWASPFTEDDRIVSVARFRIQDSMVSVGPWLNLFWKERPQEAIRKMPGRGSVPLHAPYKCRSRGKPVSGYIR